MRIFENALEAFMEIERDLYEMGTTYKSETVQDQKLEGQAQDTLELFGYGYTIKSQDKKEEMLEYGKLNKEWAFAELAERVGGNYPPNPGQAWKLNGKFWGQFIRNGVFSYSYPERWQWQLPYIIHELREKPNTRQAYMTMYSAEKDMMNWGGRDRVPCSIGYQFLIRNNQLHLVYNQRSCDFVKFLGYDMFLTMGLQVHVASRLGIAPGNFTHFLGSLHAFRTDLEEKGIF